MQYPHHADGGRVEQIRQPFGNPAMRNAGFGKIIAYGQNVEKRDLPVK